MKQVATAASESPAPLRDRSRAFGAILVEQGRLNPADAEEIQRFAASNGLRFGEAAIQLKLLTHADIDFALAQQYNYPILARGGASGVSDDVVAGYMPQSDTVEPLRVLRSQLTHRWFNSVNQKALAVTSPGRGEGRSWLAANLATVFAQIGERTLLIDADMRHPRQHHLFNLNNSVGLSSLLTGRAGKEAAFRINPQLRLFVLPAGILPPNPQELLGRSVFDLVLERFIDQFDVIIIDTPAAAQTADAQIVAKRAGGAIMLARRSLTRQSQLAASTRTLVQAGVNVVGTVYNDF